MSDIHAFGYQEQLQRALGKWDLLAYGMAHEVNPLDEKCYLEVFQPRQSRPVLKKKVKV